jgi:singapore isolate B (sub-type 7) whole genome shotgun sequence assembly, scaffold_1
MAALEKRLKEFQKKAGNKNCFVCNQKVSFEKEEIIHRDLSIS